MIDGEHRLALRLQFLHCGQLRSAIRAILDPRIFRRIRKRINCLGALLCSGDQAAGLVRRIPPRLGDERFELFTNQLHKSEF